MPDQWLGYAYGRTNVTRASIAAAARANAQAGAAPDGSATMHPGIRNVSTCTPAPAARAMWSLWGHCERSQRNAVGRNRGHLRGRPPGPADFLIAHPERGPPPAPRPPTGVAQQVARRAPAAGARDAECGMQLQLLPHHPLIWGGGGRGRLGACCYCLTCFESC
jgi:hypothetical protein